MCNFMDEKLVTFLIRFICEEKHPNKINEKQKFLKYRKENSIVVEFMTELETEFPRTLPLKTSTKRINGILNKR